MQYSVGNAASNDFSSMIPAFLFELHLIRRVEVGSWTELKTGKDIMKNEKRNENWIDLIRIIDYWIIQSLPLILINSLQLLLMPITDIINYWELFYMILFNKWELYSY